MTEIQKYTSAAIAKIDDIGQLAQIVDVAKAAEIFYRAQDAWEQAQRAADVKLRAIHRAGRILLPPEQGGVAVREPGQRTDLITPGSEVTPYQQMLDEAGISPKTAHIWQKIGRIKEETLEAYLAEAYEREELTIASLLQHAGFWFGRSDAVEWETPQWLFDALNEEFRFALDVCALPGNAKCKRFYQPSDDGLMQIWKGVCWMNPPYGKTIIDWMRKARGSADNGATVVCLVPARTDTEWWWTSCPMSEVRFIRGRLQWPVKKENGEILNWTTAPFPSAVVVMRPNQRGKVVWWDVQSQIPQSARY
jgi:phage N-6-adenine-methyltransferase